MKKFIVIVMVNLFVFAAGIFVGYKMKTVKYEKSEEVLKQKLQEQQNQIEDLSDNSNSPQKYFFESGTGDAE
jgi:Tfp pilus assembly protein PilO